MVQEQGSRFGGVRFLVAAAALVILIAGMRAAETLLVPFLLAAFFAVVCVPPVSWLKGRGVPSALAVFLVVAGIIALEVLLAALVGSSLDDFSRALPTYQLRLQDDAGALFVWLEGLGIQISDRTLLEVVDPGAAMRLAAAMLSGLGGALTNSFLIMLTVIFILLEAASFPAKLQAAFGSIESSMAHFNRFSEGLQRYLVIKTLVSLGTGGAVALWLWVMGVDFPLLWGLLAFLLNYVPNIGSIIAAVPAVLLGYIQFGPTRALLVAAGYLVVNLVAGNVIEPRFLGRSLGLSTLVVFLSLVFWGWVLGPVGMLLSVPLTMTAKIALESREESRWMAVLLGPEG